MGTKGDPRGNRPDLTLKDGSRVCIVGGGPAGSFSALHLHRYARQRGIRLEVIIFEPRDFQARGPKGCKGCAGILSTRLLNGLAGFGLALPKEVIQSELHSYAAHFNGDVIRIKQPDPQRRIISVYRGGGPHLVHAEPVESFDRFLLAQACAIGTRHIQASVIDVQNNPVPVVSTRKEQYPADLLVLATGVSSNNPLSPTFGYHGPKTSLMVQEELPRPLDWPKDEVNVFFNQTSGLIFGVLTPKGPYINVSLLGHGLTQDASGRFLESNQIDLNRFSALAGLCGCLPRIAVKPARNFFGDRWVAVGDAAVTRLYKDGIGSAFYTAKTALKVAIFDGISKDDFQRGYAPYCRSVAVDNLFGKLLFRLWERTQKTPRLLRAWKFAVRREEAFPPQQKYHMRILWGMLTGDEFYKDLTMLFLKSPAVQGLWSGLF